MNRIERALASATDTEALVIGKGAVLQTPAMFNKLFPDRKAIVVTQPDTWRVAGEEVCRLLYEAGIQQDKPFMLSDENMHAEWKYIETLDRVLAETDAVPVAVGSGVVNDLVKLCSHHNSRKYIVVGTAASMDGYTSFGASITKDGNKQTFSCPAPVGVIFDTAIAAAAPEELSASGYADLLAKIPGGADWMLADAVGAEKLDPAAFSLVQDGLREALNDPAGVRAGDAAKVEQLSEGLLMSGFAMQAIQSSRPASGAEHIFSHLCDMEHLNVDGQTFSHGFQVGIGTLASTAFYGLLFQTSMEEMDVEKCVAEWKSWDETERDIRAMFHYGPELIARGIGETKAKYIDKDGLRTQLLMLREAWPTLKVRLEKQIIPLEDVRERLKLVGAPYEPEHIGLTRKEFLASYRKLPYMRSRYTIIDLAVRCGWFDRWLDALFGKGGCWEI